MTTLTLYDLLHHPAKNQLGRLVPVGGMSIHPSHHWPTIEDGTEMRRFPAHPIIRWLARWLPVTPYVEMEVTKWRDADPMYDKRSGALYCSHAQADMLRETAPPLGPGDRPRGWP
jgi:hypothetical protein